MEALLQLKGIDKAFPGVKALSGAALNVYPVRFYGWGKKRHLPGQNLPRKPGLGLSIRN